MGGGAKKTIPWQQWLLLVQLLLLKVSHPSFRKQNPIHYNNLSFLIATVAVVTEVIGVAVAAELAIFQPKY